MSEAQVQESERQLRQKVIDALGCCCCDAPIIPRDPDPWDGRLDGYCEDCALTRCDAYPGDCLNGGVAER